MSQTVPTPNAAPALPIFELRISQGGQTMRGFIDRPAHDHLRAIVASGAPFRVNMSTPGGYASAIYSPAFGGIAWGVDVAVGADGQVYIPVNIDPSGRPISPDYAEQIKAANPQAQIGSVAPTAPACSGLFLRIEVAAFAADAFAERMGQGAPAPATDPTAGPRAPAPSDLPKA